MLVKETRIFLSTGILLFLASFAACKPTEVSDGSDTLEYEGTAGDEDDSVTSSTIEITLDTYVTLVAGSPNSRFCSLARGSRIEANQVSDSGADLQFQDVVAVKSFSTVVGFVLPTCEEGQFKTQKYFLSKSSAFVVNKAQETAANLQNNAKLIVDENKTSGNQTQSNSPYQSDEPMGPNQQVPNQQVPNQQTQTFPGNSNGNQNTFGENGTPNQQPSEKTKVTKPPVEEDTAILSANPVCAAYLPLKKGSYSFVKGGMFGAKRKYKGGHNGQDFSAGLGVGIYAVEAGKILYAGWNAAYGKIIRILHSPCSSNLRFESFYAHMSHMDVTAKQWITPKKFLGKVGNTGSASRGNHLHFELRNNKYGQNGPNSRNGYPRVRPLAYLTKGSP